MFKLRLFKQALVKFISVIFLAIGLLFFSNSAKATHAMGGDITFSCVGPYQYLVSYSFYRDCNGVGVPSSENLNVESAQCGASFTVSLPRVSIDIVTPICVGAIDRCDDPSGIYGIERHTFEGVVDLQPWPNCGTDWIFSNNICCRNNAITSLTNPGSRGMYLYARVDNTLDVCNNSPTFLTDPVPFTCVGQPNAFNHGYSDQDGDSLVFELIQPLQNNINNPIAFQPGYSTQQPIITGGGAGAVSMNPVTGTILFTPSQQQIAVLTVRIREFRNGVQIGEYLRDIQITVLACSNNYPTATGIDGTTDFVGELCADETICFDVVGTDPDAANNLTMFWNGGVPGATFNVTGNNPTTGTFCWSPTTGQTGQYLFTVTVRDDACVLNGQNTYGYVLTVTEAFENADAGPDLTACGSVTLQGSISSSNVDAQWTVVSGSGTFSDDRDPTAFVTGLSPGLNVFQWTADYGTCGITSDQVNVLNFTTSQQPAFAGVDIEECGPNASTTLNGNTVTFPAVGTWSVISGTGTFADANDPNTAVSGLSAGLNRFRWSVDNGPCGGVTVDDVFVRVYSPIVGHSAGPDQSLCGPVASVQLNGSPAPWPASGSWTVFSGSGNFSNSSSATPQVLGAAIGLNQYIYTVNNGPCGVLRDTVDVVVFNSAQGNANAGSDVELCTPNTSLTMSANFAPAPASGQWSLVSGQGNIVSTSSNTTTINGLGIGQNVFQWTVFNGPCSTTSDLVTVSVYDSTEPAADAGDDQELCTPSTATNLSAVSPTAPAQGTWTVSAGSGNFTDINDPNTSVTGLSIGLNQFTWTVDNGPCAVSNTSGVVSVTVFNSAAVTANAGSDIDICAPTNNVTLSGNVPSSPSTGEWSLVSGPSNPVIASPSNPSTAVTGLVVGQYVLRWTIDNGPCANAITSDDVVVSVFDPSNPVANAGADQELCSPTSTANLSGSSLISPASGTWTVVSGTGIIADPNDPNTVVSGMPVGIHVFQWSVSNGNCANANTNDQVTISVFDQSTPSANAGLDQELCTPSSSTNLAGSFYAPPTVATWTQISGPSAATIVDPTDRNTSVNGLTVGSYTFRWTVGNGSCEGSPSSDDVVINVYDSTAPNAVAGSDQSLCSVTSTTLTGNPPVGVANGTWSLISGTGNIANATNSSTFVTGLSFGENIFQWQIDNGPCGITSDQVSIFVFNSADPVANAGPDISICSPVSSVIMNGSSVTAPSVGTWSLVSGTGTINSPNNPNTLISGLTVGTHVFEWEVDAGVCPNGMSSDLVTITVFAGGAAPANAGPDQNVCNVPGTAVMAGNVLTAPAIGQWSLISGSGAIGNINDPTTTITGLGVGQNIFLWSVDNGSCGTSNDFVNIFVFDDANLVANAGPDQQLCTPTSSSALSGSSVIFPSTGSWSVISGGATVVNSNDPNSGVTGLSVGVHVFEWTVNNGPCSNPSTSDQVTIEVFDDNAPVANAGPTQNVCGPIANVTMAANSAVVPASGNWVNVSGTGTIVDPTNPNTQITGLPVGVHEYRWVIDNGPCSSGITSQNVTVNVYDPADPVANAGTDIQICTPATTTNLSGSSFTDPGVGIWTVLSGSATVDDPTDPNSGVSGLTVGTHVIQWSVNNGPCPNALTTDQVIIEVFDDNNALANAGPDQDICTPITTATLAGSALNGPATGTWTLIAGSGTITDPADPNSGVTGLTVGANTFQWTVSNGPCTSPSTSDQVTINLFNGSAQSADAGPDQSFCSTTTNTIMAANAAVGIATGSWNLVQGTAVISDINNPSTTVTGMGVGEIILEWSIDNGACGISTDPVSIFVYDSTDPVADAGANQELCSPTFSTTLNGNTPTTPSIGTWSLVSGSGTITDVNDPSTTVTGLAIGVNVFEWSVDNGPCPNGTTTSQVSIEVFDENLPMADAGLDQQICTPQNSVTMAGSSVSSPATGTWTLISGVATITDPNDPATTITGLTPGTVELQWEVDNGPCASGVTTDQVTIEIFNDADPLANAGPDQEICSTLIPFQVSLAGSAVTSPSVGTWNLVCGSGNFADSNDPNTVVTGLSIGENCFVWSVSNGPCTNPNSTDTVVVSVFDETSPVANAGADQSFCTPINFAALSGSVPVFPSTGTWTVVSGSGTFVDAADPNTTINSLGIGTNVLRWTVNNGPCSAGITQDEVSITIFDGNAQVSNAGSDQQICSDNPVTTLAGNNPVAAATGQWTISSGAAVFADDSSPTTGVSALPVGETVLLWTIDNGTCGSSVDSVSLFVFDENNAVANAGPDQDLCTPITTTTMAAATPTFPASGTWTLVSGTGTIVDPSNPATTISGLALGTNVFEWTVNNGACASPITSDQITINVFAGNAQIADAGPDQDICSDNPNTTVTGSIPVLPATGTWTVAAGVASITSPNAATTTVTALGNGQVDLVWSIDNGSCGTTTDTVSIFVFDVSGVVADAGADQDLCTPVSNTTMNGSAVTFPAEGTWTLISGSGTIQNVNDPLTAISGLAIGANVFEWSVDNGPCPNGITTDQVTINVFDGGAVLADAGADQSYCTPQDTAVMSANTATGVATGQWTLTQGTGTFANANDPNTLVSGLSVGENIFTWTIDNGSCGTSSDQISVFIFDTNNDVADAGPNQNLCTPATTSTLAGSAITFPAVGTWSVVSGTATITDANNPTTTITGLTPGVVVLQWTVNNGPCNFSPSTDLVTITINDATQPAANAGPDQQLCTPNISTSLAANVANAPAVGTWTLIGGTGVLADANDPTTVVTGLSIGENTFVWTVDNGACVPSNTTDTVSLFVFDASMPSADAGADISICTPANSVNLNANAPVFPASGTWSLLSGSGTIADVNDPNTLVSALPVGTHVFEWTTDNGPCSNGVSTDQVTVFVFDDSNPTANAGTDILICLPTTSANLAATAIVAPATGQWTIIAGSGTFQDSSNANSLVSDLSVGVNTFVWTVDNGPCTAGISTDTVDVILFDNGGVPSNAGPDQSLCTPNTSTTMAGSAVTFPEVGVWITVQGGGTFADVNDPSSAVTNLPIGENIFVWSVNNGPCPSGVTGDTVSVFVFDQNNPNANAGPDQNICLPTNSTNLAGSVNTVPAVGTWSLVQGTGIIADANDPNTQVNGLTVGENIFVWSVNNGPCANSLTTDTVSIFIFSSGVTAANAGTDIDLCTSVPTTNMSANVVVFPSTGLWTVASGAATFADPTNPFTQISNVGLGINELVWTVNNGPCPTGITSDTVVVQLFNDNSPTADAGPDQSICTPQASVSLAGNTPAGLATGSWTVVQGAGTVSTANASDPNTTLSGLQVGQTIMVWTIDNGVCGITTDTMNVFVFDQNSPVADAGVQIDLCTPEDSVLLTGVPPTFPASVTWTVLTGGGTIVDPTDPTSLVTGLSFGTNQFQMQVDNGPCPSGVTFDTLTVVLFSDTTAPADAGLDQQICSNNNSTNLAAASTQPPAVGTWTVLNGSGVFADVNDPNTQVTGMSIGINEFIWTLDNGPCPTYGITSDTVRVTMYNDQQAPANAGLDVESCLFAGAPNTQVTVFATAVPLPAIGYWTLLSGNATIADSSSASTTVSGLVVGSYSLMWTVDNGPCPGGLTTDTMEIRIYDPQAPLADAGLNDSICAPNNTVQLAGNAPVLPGVGVWTSLSGVGSIANTLDPNSQVTGLPVGVHQFEWYIYNGFCGFGVLESWDTTDVYVFDPNSPNADAGPDQDICFPGQNSVTMAGSVPIFPATGMWSSATSTATIADPSNPATAITGLTIGVHEFVWTSLNGPCANGITRDTVLIRVFDDNAPDPNAGPDQAICVPTSMNQITMAADPVSFPGSGYWTLLSGTASIADSTQATTLVTGLTVGTHEFSWTVVNGSCWTRVDTMVVQVFDDSQTAADAGPDQTICTPTTSTNLAGNATISPAIGTWTIISGTGNLADANDPNTLLDNLSVGQVVLEWSIDNGPCLSMATRDTVVIFIFDSNADAAMAGPDQDFCTPINTPVTMFSNAAVSPALGTWSLVSGAATIASPNDPFTVITGLGLGPNVFEWEIDNGGCGTGTTTDQITIRVYDHTQDTANAGESVIYCQDVSEHQLAAIGTFTTGTGTWSLLTSFGQLLNANSPNAVVGQLNQELHILEWTVDNGVCGTTTDTMTILIEDCLTLTIPNAFSPNDDGTNDIYVIDNIDSYPTSNFQVFNRWGTKILDRDGYNNDWDGRSEHPLTWGDELPEGTYYYVLAPGEGFDNLTGYIYLKR